MNTDPVRLDASLEFRDRTPGDGYGGELLLTGSTGPLGRYLLAELLDRTAMTVHVPVDAADVADGFQHIRRCLADAGRWQPAYAARIQPVPADLGRPWLGLRSAQFVDLAARLDGIYHCAADDHLVRGYDELARVNVAGTNELLRLAAYGRGVRFEHLSIVMVAPVEPATNRWMEAWPDERPVGAEGFTRTKWVAERLVAQAARRGLHASTYRTTTLTGDRDGRYPGRDVLVEYIQGTMKAGVYPERGRVGCWTPVDYAAAAIALLSTQPAGVYHVPGCAVPFQWVWEHLRGWGCPLRAGRDDQWRAAVRAAGVPLTYLLGDDSYHGDPDAGDPEENRAPPPGPSDMDCSRALAVLGQTLGEPVITAELVGRYLDDLRAKGLL
jgi:thioester reductase-like protein